MTQAKPLPSQKVLHETFDYNPETGDLIWKVRPDHQFSNPGQARSINSREAGRVAGANSNRGGYIAIGITLPGEKVFNYFAHRLVWKWVHGVDPEDIDHINGNIRDNRIANLRSVPHSENMKNAAMKRNNKSGVVGVCKPANFNKWVATIKVNKKQVHLGSFERLEDAKKAREQAEIAYGYHKNHGRPPGATA